MIKSRNIYKVIAALLVSSFVFSIQSCWAGEKDDKKSDGVDVKAPGLTSAKPIRCDAGYYLAGLRCRLASPGYYLAPGDKYPTICPKGFTSKAGANSLAKCFELGNEPVVEVQPKKSPH